MFLYELAMALDQRSPDVVDAAIELGMGELLPATELSAEQVAALRAHFDAIGRPPPLAPRGSGAPPLPAVQTGPLVAEPGPASPAPGGLPAAPSAPVAWGPPVDAPTPVAPPTWGPPPGAAPPDPDHAGPYFAYPEGATAPEVVDAPIGLDDVILPPPPPPSKPPAQPAAAAPTGPGGLGRGQLVLLGVVAVLVVGLFGFMVVNTGPDKAKEQALAQKQAELESELNATTAPLASTTTTAAATTTTAQDAYAPVDVATFCRGGVAVATFDLRLAAATVDKDFAELSGLVRERRAAWEGDVDTMAKGAAPILVDDIERYRAGYEAYFDQVSTSSTFDELMAKVDRLALLKASNSGQEVGAQISFECKER